MGGLISYRSVEDALGEVPRWRTGDVVVVRGRCRLRVDGVDRSDVPRAPGKLSGEYPTYQYTFADENGVGVASIVGADEFTGGRRSAVIPEVFTSDEKTIEQRIKKSSADGAPPSGIESDN
jgi:hypothetical protein